MLVEGRGGAGKREHKGTHGGVGEIFMCRFKSATFKMSHIFSCLAKMKSTLPPRNVCWQGQLRSVGPITDQQRRQAPLPLPPPPPLACRHARGQVLPSPIDAPPPTPFTLVGRRVGSFARGAAAEALWARAKRRSSCHNF